MRQRFEREAKTISALSHPHICALYDVGNQDGAGARSRNPLFSLPRGSTGAGAFEAGTSSGFDVSPDGKRFLIVVREVVGDELPLSVVVNWTAEIAN